jgi:hypothetical protein
MRSVLVGVAVLAVAVVCAQAAVAAPAAIHVSGTYEVSDFGTTTCAPLAKPFLVGCSTTGFVSQYDGSLEGSSTSSFVQVINCETGRTAGIGTETFTGSVEGVGSGTLTWLIRFRSAFDCATFSVSNFSATGVIVSGTGDLAGLEGKLHFGDVTYEGDLR